MSVLSGAAKNSNKERKNKMALIQLKKDVNLTLSTEMALLTGYVARLWTGGGMGAFVITSARDGAHMEGSKHYSGNAVDIRTKAWLKPDGLHKEEVSVFVKSLRARAGAFGLDVHLHPEDDIRLKLRQRPAHLHLEYDPQEGEQLWEFVR